jgi:hypothetical protein
MNLPVSSARQLAEGSESPASDFIVRSVPITAQSKRLDAFGAALSSGLLGRNFLGRG